MAKLPRLRKEPRSNVTGTSYNAVGTTPPPPLSYNELGSANKGFIADPVPAVSQQNPAQAAITYMKMWRTDVSVRISLRAGEAPVLGGDFFIEPYDDSEQSQVIAEYLNWQLFEAMTTPWVSTLQQILKMYRDGFSVLEPVWELREWAPNKTIPGANRRTYTSLRKLAVRPASTISSFQYDDNGGPVAAIQQALDANGQAKEVPIPITKLVVFTNDKDGGDLRGNSMLRTAYEHFFYKYNFYKIDGIQKERHGIGFPVVELQPGYSEADKLFAHQLGANIRTNERAHAVTNTLVKLQFAELSGNLVDVLKSAIHHDDMIMKNLMVQFLQAGINESSGGGGGRSGATSMDMFLKAMRFIAQYICDQLNLYLIPQMVAFNFKTDQFPKLCVRNIGEVKDLQMWATAMANLVDKRLITMDDETEKFVRRILQMPLKTGPRPPLADELGPHDTKDIIQGGAKGTSGANGSGGGGTGATSGNTGKSPSSGAV